DLRTCVRVLRASVAVCAHQSAAGQEAPRWRPLLGASPLLPCPLTVRGSLDERLPRRLTKAAALEVPAWCSASARASRSARPASSGSSSPIGAPEYSRTNGSPRSSSSITGVLV